MDPRKALTFALLAACPLGAHHQVSDAFDTVNPIALRGAVRNVQWKNPHVIVEVEQRQPDGRVAAWQVELPAPGYLTRAHITPAILEGTGLSLEVYPAKDGSPFAVPRSASVLSLDSGQKADMPDTLGRLRVK